MNYNLLIFLFAKFSSFSHYIEYFILRIKIFNLKINYEDSQIIIGVIKQKRASLLFESHSILSSVIANNKYLLPIIFEYLSMRIDKTNLLMIIDMAKVIKSFQSKNKIEFDSYFSFTRFSNGIDKVGCDWCSIINGILELLILETEQYYSSDNFNPNNLLIPSSIKQFSDKWTSLMRRKIPGFLKIDDRGRPSINQIKVFTTILDDTKLNDCQKNISIEFITEIIRLKNIVEIIETRYCPFKHLTEINFDRPYYYYSSNNIKELKMAQEILRERGQIRCDECVEIINSNKNYIYKISPSIFDDYMIYIKNIMVY